MTDALVPSPPLEDAAFPVLEKLSRATEQLLEPPRLRDEDCLFLWLDADGRRFVADLRAMRRLGGGEEPWFRHDGVTLGRVRLPDRWADVTDWPGTSRAAQEFFQRVPERKSLKEEKYERRFRWRLAATDFTALVVHHCWPLEKIFFRPPGLESDGSFSFPEDEEARLKYRYLLARFFGQTARARAVAAFKSSRELPPLPDQWVESQALPLADYQRLAAQLILGMDSIAIFADRGTGKTAPTIQAMCHLAREKRRGGKGMLRAIVACPAQARKNWETEVGRFATIPGKVTVVRGGMVDRIRCVHRAITSEPDCAFSLVVVSYETLVNTIDVLRKIPWDLAAADESHKFKSSDTKRWKDGVRVLRDCAAVRVPLTGTPIGNTYLDLWTQLEFCGTGLSGFESLEGFRKFHGQWQEVPGAGHGVERLVSLKNVPLLQERLARLTFSITKEEAGLKLPQKVYDFWEVEMTPAQEDLYREVATHLKVEIEDRLSGQKDSITIENILVSLLRLAQITSGHVGLDVIRDPLTGEVTRERRTKQISTPNPKVEAIVEMLQDEERDPRGKTIVWCCFVPDILAIAARLEELGIERAVYYGGVSQSDRDLVERRFNWDPSCRVMVCNPQTAGEALNLVGFDWDNPDSPRLETYTDHEVFFSCNWSSLQRDQAEDRAHRRSMRAPRLRITDLIVPDTIDEEIRLRVRLKQDMARLVLDIGDILRTVFSRT